MMIIARSGLGSIMSPETAIALRKDRAQELRALKTMTPEEVRTMLRSRGLLTHFQPLQKKRRKSKRPKVRKLRYKVR